MHIVGGFLWSILDHWLFSFGGVVLVIFALVEKYKNKPTASHAFWGLAALCFAIAIFQAWDDERVRADDAERKLRESAVAVHLTPGVPSVVPQSLANQDILPIGRVAKLAQPWIVSGNAPALHERDRAYCYIPDDHEETTQDRLIEESIKKWEADPIRLTKEGRDETAPMLFGEFCSSDAVVDQELYNGVKFGHKFLFVIAVARFSDVRGEHESHSCQWMEAYPAGENNMVYGKWNTCHKYATQIDVAGK